MPFSINTKSFGDFKLYEIADTESLTSVCIIPSCGALLNNFTIKQNDQLIDIVNGYKSHADLIENLSKNFKGVILSPFANRVNKASYNFNNSTFTLDKVWVEKDYAIHGLLYNKNFEVTKTDANDNQASITLLNKYDGNLQGFPFSFETTVLYTLHKNNQLTCETYIQNTSNELMPMSFGWHPMFFNDVNIDEVKIEFPSLYKVDVDVELIPTGNKITYEVFNKSKQIGATIFDHCFKLNKEAIVKLLEPLNKIKIELQIETGDNKFKYLQIYIPPQRNTIALEPMSSWPDAFNNKNDLITLKPAETVLLNYTIKVSTF